MEASQNFQIGNRPIGPDHPSYIIAELSANHNKNYELAVETIKAAKTAGADAVKLQTYRPDTITLDSDLPHFKTRQDSLWAGQRLYDLYEKAFTPWEWHPRLMKIAHEMGLDFFSSPFDTTAVDFLAGLNVPAYKIASLEITDIPLIQYVASQGKPIIISTGAAIEDDIRLAVDTCRRVGNDQIALLKCTAAYPTPASEVNLRTIPLLAASFGTLVGLSDHTLGPLVPSIAVGLGACIIEKHIILDRKLGGVDSAFSLTAEEFKEMVQHVRKAEEVIGDATLAPTEKMINAMTSRRSLFCIKDIAVGEVLTTDNVRSLRPGLGLHPRHLQSIIGQVANRDISRGTPLSAEMIDAFEG